MVHGCMVDTERAEMAAVSHGTSHVTIKQHCKYTTLVDILKNIEENKIEKNTLDTHVNAVSLLKCYIKVINNKKLINNVCSS